MTFSTLLNTIESLVKISFTKSPGVNLMPVLNIPFDFSKSYKNYEAQCQHCEKSIAIHQPIDTHHHCLKCRRVTEHPTTMTMINHLTIPRQIVINRLQPPPLEPAFVPSTSNIMWILNPFHLVAYKCILYSGPHLPISSCISHVVPKKSRIPLKIDTLCVGTKCTFFRITL